MTTTSHGADGANVIGLDVGGTEIKAAVMAEDGTVVHTECRPTGAERGPNAVIDAVLDCAADLARRYRPATAGVVIPGILDERTGTCLFAANLGWRNVPVRNWLAEELGIPVAFGHDVRAGGMAEARLGAGRGMRHLLFVPIGTGVAAAILQDGRVLTGSRGAAGELGHVVVRPGGPPCPCGGRGCLEAVASASAIARHYNDATGETGVTAKDVLTRAEAGDSVAAAIWQEAVEALADGLASAITLLDPECVIIGGGLAQAGRSYLESLDTALTERLTFQMVPELVSAELGHQAGCLGAALMALDLHGRGITSASPRIRQQPTATRLDSLA